MKPRIALISDNNVFAMNWYQKQLTAAAVLLCLATPLSAGFPWHGGFGKHYDPPPHLRPADRHVRAGCPQSVAPWAHCSYNTAYDGYYVGGGAVHRGDGPWFPDEGTWGWDYFGRHLDRHVALGWWHGRRHQSGGGKYDTDGPKVLHKE
jgi:hypothetical protein